MSNEERSNRGDQEEFNEWIENMIAEGEIDRDDVFFLIPEYTGEF